MAAHQHAVRVDAIRRTGDQRQIILPRINRKLLKFIWHHNADLINLIGQDLVEHCDLCNVSLLELVHVGEDLCAGQASVAGDHTMGSLSADRQGASLNVTDRDLQNCL